MAQTKLQPESRPTPSSTIDALLDHYSSVRGWSRRICCPLSVEDHSLQGMPDASPAKWHLAHTTWFFETFVLSEALPGYRVFNPAFRNLFNSYYNAVGDRPLRALRHMLSRPSLDEVHAYREHVDLGMATLLAGEPSPQILDLIILGLHHEQQHQELIVTDVKYGLWTNPLRPAYRAEQTAPIKREAGRLDWIFFSGGLHSIGFDGEGFCFDNERERHQVFLEPFRLASRLVTNGEYLQFMQDAGYREPNLWLSEGWDCVQANRWSAPLYWKQHAGEWCHYGVEGERPVDLHDPVCHISYYEADAFARWAGARLATESEWETAAASVPITGNFLESNYLMPQAADDTEPLRQMFGDVWEWTSSAYLPYPGFKPAAGAVGEYNGKFMCNQMVLRGGSCATPQSHIRATYRNFFPPPARWQFMGIRLANGD